MASALPSRLPWSTALGARSGLGLGAVLVAGALGADADGLWRRHVVYQPRIEQATVADPVRHGLPYNHDSAVAWFGDRWFCLWNANTVGKEGAPGQLNYVSTSPDGSVWSPPEPAFSSPERSANPVLCRRATQWQPSLIVVDGELWAFWVQHNWQQRDEPAGVHFSRLTNPDGTWHNRLLTFDAGPWTRVDGKEFTIFPTQNAYRLRRGRILVPVTMTHRQRSPDASDALQQRLPWTAFEKRDSVLYSDDGGVTWQVSEGTILPGQSFSQWEPTVWEQQDGSVLMFGRTEHVLPPEQGGPTLSQWLRRAVSRDGGATWSPYVHVPIETIRSRMHVFPRDGFGTSRTPPPDADFSDRLLLMAHNDWQGLGAGGMQDRRNLALFFKRGDGFEFTAGIGLSGRLHQVAYPMAAIHGETLLITHSHGPESQRRIVAARITPAPDPNLRYLLPRSNTEPSAVPDRDGATLVFNRSQVVATAAPVTVDDGGFSLAAWVLPRSDGVLFDCRDGGRGGFVVGLSHREQGLRPFFFLNPTIGNQEFPLALATGRWNFVGLTVDNQAGKATILVNDATAELAFAGPAATPLAGATAHIGFRRLAGSQLQGIDGALRFLAVYSGPALTPDAHRFLRRRLAVDLGLEAAAVGTPPAQAPVVWLDPGDEAGLARDFRLPEAGCAAVMPGSVDGRQCLVFRGDASAGVDLDANQRSLGHVVEMTCRFALLEGDEHVVLAVGDANVPARVVHERGTFHLQVGDQRAPLGPRRAAAPASATAWQELSLRTGAGVTAVGLDGAPEVVLPHHPEGTWVYLGQGYRHSGPGPANTFAIDVDSVRSRVRR